MFCLYSQCRVAIIKAAATEWGANITSHDSDKNGHAIHEVMWMTAKDCWMLFWETGAPEYYVLYLELRTAEETAAAFGDALEQC